MTLLALILTMTLVLLSACVQAEPTSTPTRPPATATKPPAATATQPMPTATMPMPTATTAPAATAPAASPTAAATSVPAAPPPGSGNHGLSLPPGFAVYFLDMGKGDAVLLQAKNGETMLIDGGPSRQELAGALDRLGVNRVDVIVATHWHDNHVAGLVEALMRYEVKRFYWNGDRGLSPVFREVLNLADLEAKVKVVGRGDKITLDNVELDVLHPYELSGNPNASSLVLRAGCGSVGVLFTGDIIDTGEAELVASGMLKTSQVFMVSNHAGERTASPDLLRAAGVERAVISWANGDPRYPHATTLERLRAANIEVFVTDSSTSIDAVTMVSDCKTYQMN